MTRRLLLPAPLLLLAACAGDGAGRPAALPAPAAARVGGLERVMNQASPALIALFGQPALDVHEGKARKMQWQGPACVLDAYLYPPASGTGEARVTWIDARTPAGIDFDKASCIAALARAPGGRR